MQNSAPLFSAVIIVIKTVSLHFRQYLKQLILGLLDTMSKLKLLQGDPKQTGIFQTDRTLPKMSFWVKNSIRHYDFLDVLLKFSTGYQKNYANFADFMKLSYFL